MMIEKISRISLIAIWIYHGLVPKLLFGNHQEVLMNSTFMPFIKEEIALFTSGILELIYAFLLIIYFRSSKILYPSIFFSIVATFAILLEIPVLFQNAFNPFSTNISVCALSVINLIALRDSRIPKS